MKRGTIDHPKTLRLAAALEIERWGAVGVLESLWHFVAAHAPEGDVGRWTNLEIAAGIRWQKSADDLVQALVVTHWLDKSKKHRLLVHDWSQHCDDSVKKKILYHKREFARDSQRTADNSRESPCKPSHSHSHSLKPEPKPNTLLPADAGERAPKALSDFDAWYAAYPRKVHRKTARAAYAITVKGIALGRGIPVDEAAAWLLSVTQVFAATPVGRSGQFVPYPATWLRAGAYDDDQSEWQRERTTANERPQIKPFTVRPGR